MTFKLSKKEEKEIRLSVVREIAYKAAAMPESWLRVARQLAFSAELLLHSDAVISKRKRLSLMPDPFLLDQELHGAFLYALSIENLIKGLYVFHCDPNFKDVSQRDVFFTHDTRSILAKIPIDSRPKISGKLLKVLQSHVEWIGKYPIPKSATAYMVALKNSEVAAVRAVFSDLRIEYKKLEIG